MAPTFRNSHVMVRAHDPAATSAAQSCGGYTTTPMTQQQQQHTPCWLEMWTQYLLEDITGVNQGLTVGHMGGAGVLPEATTWN